MDFARSGRVLPPAFRPGRPRPVPAHTARSPQGGRAPEGEPARRPAGLVPPEELRLVAPLRRCSAGRLLLPPTLLRGKRRSGVGARSWPWPAAGNLSRLVRTGRVAPRVIRPGSVRGPGLSRPGWLKLRPPVGGVCHAPPPLRRNQSQPAIAARRHAFGSAVVLAPRRLIRRGGGASSLAAAVGAVQAAPSSRRGRSVEGGPIFDGNIHAISIVFVVVVFTGLGGAGPVRSLAQSRDAVAVAALAWIDVRGAGGRGRRSKRQTSRAVRGGRPREAPQEVGRRMRGLAASDTTTAFRHCTYLPNTPANASTLLSLHIARTCLMQHETGRHSTTRHLNRKGRSIGRRVRPPATSSFWRHVGSHRLRSLSLSPMRGRQRERSHAPHTGGPAGIDDAPQRQATANRAPLEGAGFSGPCYR